MAEQQKDLKTIPSEETALFCEQVAMVLKGGIPLRTGMETLCNNYKNTRYGDKFQRINDAVQEGGSLGDALESAGFFPRYMVNMTRVGEYTGTLDEVMESLAQFYHREAQIRNNVTSAIVYPAILALMMAVVIGVLVIGVMPVFQRVFASLGSNAVSASASAMNIGGVLGRVVLIAVGVMIVLIGIVALLLQTKSREKVLEFLARVFPPMRRINEASSAARFASVSEVMLKSGYNLNSTVELARGVIADRASQQKLDALETALESGTPFAQGVADMEMYEGIHNRMIETGASVGQLDSVMQRLRQSYEQKADMGIARAVSLIEPAMVAVLSFIVGGILLSVMLPLVGILTSMT